jgi:hypothetical protein
MGSLKMKFITELVPDIPVEVIWKIVDAIADDSTEKKHKTNMTKFFKRDGALKTVSLKTPKDFQDWHDTQIFIRSHIRKRAHLNKLRQHVKARRESIKQFQESKHE